MADDRIEVEIVLDDGSIQKGFAKIRSESKKTSSFMSKAFSRATDRGFSRPLDKVRDSVLNLRTALVGAAAVIGGGAFIRGVTEAAAQQEEAVNALNVSLQTAGTFSQEASESFQELARSLQANSRFGDEVILQQAALARNYTRSNEEAEKLIKTSIDLSEATGISLDSAVRNLGKTLSGLTGELGEAVPIIRGLTTEQLKAGEAIDVLAQRFGGAALGATRTFSGALAQLQNTFGDFLESVGSSITQSPVIINLFNALSKTFESLTKNLSGSSNVFDDFLKNLVINSAAAVNAIIDSFEVVLQIPDFFSFIWLEIKASTISFINEFFRIIEPVSGFIDRIFGQAGASRAAIEQNEKLLEDINKQLEQLGKSSIEGSKGFDIARASVDEFITSFQNLNAVSQTVAAVDQSPAGPVAEAVSKDLQKLRDKVKQLQMETREAINESFFNAESVLQGTPSVFETLSDKGTKSLKALQAELQRTKDQTVQLSQQIGQAVNNGIANTIANSVSSVVDALRTGQDAFGAFAKAALATIGDLAVQLGTTLIASGIGIEALKVLGGAAAIAAGIALVAVGTLIKGASGGGAPSPTGGSSVTPPLADLEPDGISDSLQGDQSRVQVTIEGNVFDSEETGLRVAEILKDQMFNNAVVS